MTEGEVRADGRLSAGAEGEERPGRSRTADGWTPSGGDRESPEDRSAAPIGGAVRMPRLPVWWVRRPIQAAVRAWRRSIQLRVVATTLVMSVAVVLILGVVVMGQVRNGLLEAKRQSAQSQALGGFQVAQESADAAADPRNRAQAGPEAGDPQEASTWLTELVQQLASGGQGLYAVVALDSDSAQGPRGSRASGNVLPEESVPSELREALEREGGVHEQYTTVVRKGDGAGEGRHALVIGKRLSDVNGDPYQLYYLFPFAQEEKTLSLVSGTLATAGVFVVGLLGAIAWLVVRQVVTPVRMAARIAERLAAGRLQERMRVSGEDDIARLGESFNKMAQNLQVKIQQLEDLSRMQRRFVSDVSHELRTPLTTVRMAADVIHEARGDFDPVTARSAELLQNQLDRFESLLADLLEISRFDAGAAALEADAVDLRTVVHRVVEAAEPLAERKGGRIVVRGAERPVVAEADARRVERVLRNLVVNAVEHGEGRDVVVRLGMSRNAVAVAVRDHGVGLKPGEATRVFNRFWRADPARARTTGGTGLGLSIALEDARLHGGWLQAWGEPGGGSQFRLTLPVTAGGVLTRSPIPLEPEDSRRNREQKASGRGPTTGPPHGASPLGAGPARRMPPLPGGPPLQAVPPMPAIPPGSPAADPASVPGGDGGDGSTVSRVVGRRTGPAPQDSSEGDGNDAR